MKIMEHFRRKSLNLREFSAVTIAFLGDSVTQGCFEVSMNADGNPEPVFDQSHAYHTYLKRMLSILYPSVSVNIINAGISGDDAPGGLRRVKRDVVCYHPDLTVVSFGLNDCGKGKDNVKEYTDSLRKIFWILKESNSDIIFLTPNMMNTKISPHIQDSLLKELAEQTKDLQNNGVLEFYLKRAVQICAEYQIPVCDCYADWKKLYEYGVDITSQLSNCINHPSRQLNWLFAFRILETMMK